MAVARTGPAIPDQPRYPNARPRVHPAKVAARRSHDHPGRLPAEFQQQDDKGSLDYRVEQVIGFDQDRTNRRKGGDHDDDGPHGRFPEHEQADEQDSERGSGGTVNGPGQGGLKIALDHDHRRNGHPITVMTRPQPIERFRGGQAKGDSNGILPARKAGERFPPTAQILLYGVFGLFCGPDEWSDGRRAWNSGLRTRDESGRPGGSQRKRGWPRPLYGILPCPHSRR